LRRQRGKGGFARSASGKRRLPTDAEREKRDDGE
jgi:hypothetical protein